MRAVFGTFALLAASLVPAVLGAPQAHVEDRSRLIPVKGKEEEANKLLKAYEKGTVTEQLLEEIGIETDDDPVDFPLAPEEAEKRSEDSSSLLQARAGGCNTPTNRACWDPGFNINTDYENVTPITLRTRRYTLTITEVDNWTGPDGVVKEKVMLVNNKITGPTIFADWGDNIEVTVINNLRANGTSIHWHGIHMKNTNLADGANGVTECPVPPGRRKVYRFRATQYGTSWYHSHFSAQYGNGVTGSILIYGPTSDNYDVDLGVFPISDYYYQTADKIVEQVLHVPGAPSSDNVLFNGTAPHPVTGAGTRAVVTLQPNKKHKLRLINPSTENHFQLKLQNHSMTVVATDFVPVTPKTVDSLFLGVGQRYDVIIDTTGKPAGSYWFNATFGGGGACGLTLAGKPAAIFRYQGSPNVNPPNTINTEPADHNCLDDISYSPVVSRTVPTTNFPVTDANTLPIEFNFAPNLLTWRVNGSAIDVNWNKPIAEYVLSGNTSYPEQHNVDIINGNSNTWVYWLIENDPEGTFSIPHPMHLHGHDYVVVGRSPPQAPGGPTHVFNPATDRGLLKANNPVRRDVVMLPAGGWMIMAFKLNNPGAWLMHCHIAWHVSGGLSNQFLERRTDYLLQMALQPLEVIEFNQNCRAWRDYFPANAPFPKVDSGI